MIRVEVKGQDKFPKWLQKLPDLPREVTRAAMADVRDVLLGEARKNVSKGGSRGLNVRTGNLIRNLRTRLDLTPDGAEVRLTGPFYGRVNARGAVITPKAGPYLVFQIGGRWVRSRRVVIPARPWDEDALQTAQRAFPRYLSKHLRRAAEGLK